MGRSFRRVREAAKAHACRPIRVALSAGVDWAMQTDFTVLVVMDAKTRRVVDADRFNQIDWSCPAWAVAKHGR